MKSIRLKMDKVECEVCGYKVKVSPYKVKGFTHKRLPSSHFPKHECKQKEIK